MKPSSSRSADYERFASRCSFLEEERAARRPQPKLVGSFVEKILRQVRPSVVQVDGISSARPDKQLDGLQMKWRETVGEAIADVSRVTSYRGGVLSVIVTTAAVRTELEFARSHLIEALVDLGLHGIHEIRFRAGKTPVGKVGR